jgi:hypothetical protein
VSNWLGVNRRKKKMGAHEHDISRTASAPNVRKTQYRQSNSWPHLTSSNKHRDNCAVVNSSLEIKLLVESLNEIVGTTISKQMEFFEWKQASNS